MFTFDQLFSTSYDEVQSARKRENLANEMPEGFSDLNDLDNACLKLIEDGKLVIIDSESIRANMALIKNPELTRAEFQKLALELIDELVEGAKKTIASDCEVKIAISVRGGMPFYPITVKHFAGAEYGFSAQQRDETTLQAESQESKLGSFADKTAIAVDFMLATGGSLVQMIDLLAERGAHEITAVTAFSAPQGIIKTASNQNVRKIISLPLEAGLNYIDENHHGYIVGGHIPNTMLGDFGDRFHGTVG